jgi:hypothetical protein
MNYEFQFLFSWLLGLRFGAANQGIHNLSIFGRETVPVLAKGILHHLPRGAALQHGEGLNQ